jgi:hypothetical protein
MKVVAYLSNEVHKDPKKHRFVHEDSVPTLNSKSMKEEKCIQEHLEVFGFDCFFFFWLQLFLFFSFFLVNKTISLKWFGDPRCGYQHSQKAHSSIPDCQHDRSWKRELVWCFSFLFSLLGLAG